MTKLNYKSALSFGAGALLITSSLFLGSCGSERSPVTGWAYNDPQNGGFEKVPYEEQETGPGLVLIEGGTFTFGRAEQDVTYDWNNIPRRVTVSSFYMDETEVSNFSYLEYLYWTNRVFGPSYPEVYVTALPDTLVWREKMAYNEPYVEYYLRHPAYRDYPVVGVNWLQANDFCAWRTDRVNEFILIREGLLEHVPTATETDYFSTESYLAGKWGGQLKQKLPSFDEQAPERDVRMEDGIFLPKYRLPTEAEWEFAAYGLIGNTIGERITDRRIYPWNGHGVRNPDEKYIGQIMANFVRGAGDYMGTSGWLNDNADVTSPVYSYWPNDYGLYNMAGNVSEWVLDVYRPLTSEDADEFRPFRGNVFQTQQRDPIDNTIRVNDTGAVYQKFVHVVAQPGTYGANGSSSDSLVVDSILVSIPGRVMWRDVSIKYAQDNLDERRNYKSSDYRNYNDGDVNSTLQYQNGEGAISAIDAGNTQSIVTGGTLNGVTSLNPGFTSGLMYQYTKTTLINDVAHVYKGGSWKDRAYWLNPGTRRFMDQRQSQAYLGFRCAMTRVGSPAGLGSK